MTATLDPLAILADRLDPPAWETEGRPPLEPHQVAPAGDWFLWILLGGRGSGKTEACARYFAHWMRRHPGHRGRIIAPSFGDAVESCIEGPSGLRSIDPEVRFVASAAGGAKVYWPNGSEALVIGTWTPRDVERLRAGGNRHIDWWEEMAANPQLEAAWEQAEFGLRLGDRPHAIASTTPRSKPILRRLLAAEGTVTTHGTIDDNPHLQERRKQQLKDRWAGTRIGKQELEGVLLADEEDVVVPLSWAQACQEVVERPPASLLPIELGVDVGAGGDESVIQERRGPVAGRVWRDRQPDTMQVVGKVLHAIEQTGATSVKVDLIGVGHGAHDRLVEMKRERHRLLRGVSVHGVNVGASSTQPERFERLRDELWWEIGRRLSEDRAWDLASLSPAALDQLTAPRFAVSSSGRVRVEPKEETRRRLGRSPDDADALLLAFFTPTRRDRRVRVR